MADQKTGHRDQIIDAEVERCRFLDVDDPGVVLDVDTPEVLQALSTQFT